LGEVLLTLVREKTDENICFVLTFKMKSLMHSGLFILTDWYLNK